MLVRSRWLRSTRLRRPLAAAFGIVLAIGAGSATARFMWCSAMQTARTACCCPVDHDRDTWRAPCCEAQQAFAPDGIHTNEGKRAQIPAAAPAPLVALQALGDVRGAPPRADHSLYARAGPSERLHAVYSIYLL